MPALSDVFQYAASYGREPADVQTELVALVGLLGRWQRVQNLVSRETLDDAWIRHVLDSLQLLPLIPEGPLRIVDIGSGGGFPALPLAIALKAAPVRLHLLEANARKCAYLNAAKRELGLDIAVHCGRIESIPAEAVGGPADVLTARALAPLDVLFGYLEPFWGPQTRALLHKGREYGEEIAKADSVWRFDVVHHRSKTDAQGAILEIANLSRR
ncbi:16S rRNA (guanine(527)-N(7))-methyltransferase RsmG [Pelagibacterium montanilacus]|uniref:16S rRNA (guanine(527)-N(7))-methyltransferase RsmG n=1 Tax=Pelagibacterium montanilacus TaxID=2185280 RepID=UPI000F8DEEB0|nr:16S rRNA (guanine(527)-N(7))-methyltransferase RsmG [Pelagibacterium montanilacus]